MRKITSICIVFLMLLAVMPTAFAQNTLYELGKNVFTEDFTGAAEATFSYKNTTDNAKVSFASSENAEDAAHGDALSLTFRENISKNDNFATVSKDSVEKKGDVGNKFWLFEYDFKVDCVGRYTLNLWKYAGTATSNTNANIATFDRGILKYKDGTETKEGPAYTQNEWHSIKVYLNLDGGTYHLWLDGSVVAENAVIDTANGTTDRLTGIRFAIPTTTAYTTDGTGKMYLDNLVLNTNAALEVESASIENSFEGFLVNDEIVICYNNRLDSINAADITVTDEGGEEAAFTAATDAKQLKISFKDNPLAFSNSYTLKVKSSAVTDVFGQNPSMDTQLDFKTAEESIVCEMPYFTDALGNKLEAMPNENFYVKTEAANYTAAPKTAVLIAGIYDAEGNLVKMYDPVRADAAENGGKTELSLQINISEAMGNTVRAFCIDDLENYRPVSMGYSEIDGEKRAEFISDASLFTAELNDLKVTDSEVSVSGTAQTGKVLTAALMKADGTVLSADAIKADANGSFSYKYAVSASEQATVGEVEYKIAVNGRGAETVATRSVYYINTSTREAILDAINKAENTDDIAEIFTTYKNSFNLEEEIHADRNYKVVLEQKPYEAYDDVILMIKRADSLLKELNSLDWTEATEFLEKNHEIILCDTDEYEEYTELSAKKQNAVNQILWNMGEAESFDEFRDNLKAALEEYYDSQNKASGSKGGGGGGGGAKISSAATVIPQQESQVKENETAKEEKTVFSDTENAAWAKEAIEALSERNIINGFDDGTFKPENAVKREEFVKMLALAFGIEKSDEVGGFNDCDENAWYAEFLKSAKAAGIVNGDDNGNFGIGKEISRQDAAVMVWRILKTMGKAAGDASDLSFTDESLINDYAKEAVSELSANGIINGFDDGSFMPQESLSRAQAAKIIYEVLLKYTEELQ